jgi:lipase chaperone LimK
MILKRNPDSASSSLYQGYLEYFEDLWNLETTKRVDAASVAAWPA